MHRIEIELGIQQRATYETNIPTEQTQTKKQARLSRPHGEKGRTESFIAPPSQGAEAHRHSSVIASFPKEARLLRPEEFQAVRNRGVRARAGFVVVSWLPAEKRRRLGLVVTKAVGTAVERNRIKRIIREQFRCSQELFPKGDCVVFPLKGAATLCSQDLQRHVERAVKKLLRTSCRKEVR